MTEKKCTKCGEWKFFSEFYKDKHSKDGYTFQCKVCRKKYDQSYYDKNRDDILKKDKEYQKANREYISAQQLKRYRENKEYFLEIQRNWYLENRESKLEYYREYYKKNSEKSLARTNKRRSLKKSSSTTDSWELDEINVFYAICPDGYHVDHIIPLSKGGSHELSNLQHLSACLNKNKKDKHPDDWDDPRPISCRV